MISENVREHAVAIDRSTKTEATGTQPPGRPLGEGSKPEIPPDAGPHSPGAPSGKADDGPEAGGVREALARSLHEQPQGRLRSRLSTLVVAPPAGILEEHESGATPAACTTSMLNMAPTRGR